MAENDPGLPAASDPTDEELVERAAALVPLLRANGAETERLRRLPDSTIEALEQAGIFRIFQPPNRGGLRVAPVAIAQVMTAIASGCPSTNWVLAIYNSVAQLAELLGEEALAEIYAAPHPRIAGVFGRAGAVVEPVAGGFQVKGSGFWPFNSGCRHADWDLLKVTVEEPDGTAWPAFAAVPMNELTMCDDWDVMGAMGTGSNSVACEILFIPHHRLTRVPDDMYRVFRPELAAATNCTLPLGIARYALEYFSEIAETRGINYLGHARMGDAPVVQTALARSAVDVKLIECYQQWVLSPYTGGQPHSAQEAGLPGIGSVRCFELARESVERLFAIVPSTEIQRTQPLQRLLRDIHVFQHQHAAAPFINYELYGRRFFGR